ncbi:unnamed protein product, partial [Didymodactylos carnosus]
VNTNPGNLATQAKLRNIITSLITFSDCEQCEQWISKEESNVEKIIFIVSGTFGQKILPKIHGLQQLIAVYVYCANVKRHEGWASNYTKVRTVVSLTDKLIEQISLDQNCRELMEDTKALHFTKTDDFLNNPHFVWYRLFIDLLLRTGVQPSKSDFVCMLEQYTKNDVEGKSLVKEFSKTYDWNRALWWYTRDTLLNRLVNKVLREQNIEMLFILRFLLVDIYKQLKYISDFKRGQEHKLLVYKLLPITKEELNKMKSNIGQYLCMNGFLFATRDSKLAAEQAKLFTVANGEFVLLEIDVDLNVNYMIPFGDISHLSYDQNPVNQFLFMCGSIFRIKFVDSPNKTKTWTKVQLLLADRNHELDKVRYKFEGEQDPLLIGHYLEEAGEHNKCEIFYERMQQELPKDSLAAKSCQEQLNLIRNSNKEPIKSSKEITVQQKENESYILKTKFILFELKPHLTETTKSILTILQKLVPNSIEIFETATEYEKFLKSTSNSQIIVFTDGKYASKFVYDKQIDMQVYMLCENKIDVHTHSKCIKDQFDNIDDLLCQLTDEIVCAYHKEAKEDENRGDSIKAKEKLAKAEQVHSEAMNVYNQQLEPEAHKDSSTLPPIYIRWLGNRRDGNNRVLHEKLNQVKLINQNLEIFHDEQECYESILTSTNETQVYLIISSDHFEIRNLVGLLELPNITFIYLFSRTKNDIISALLNDSDRTRGHFSNLDDLLFQLVQDLIQHYGQQGKLASLSKQTEKAKGSYRIAKQLCLLLQNYN